MGRQAAFVALTLVYLFSHYLFASNTAHVAAVYAAFVTEAVATGAPPVMAALVLGFISSLYGGLTHYASGPAPVSGHRPVPVACRGTRVLSLVRPAK